MVVDLRRRIPRMLDEAVTGMIARDVSLPTIVAPFGATGSLALLSASLLLLIGP